MQRTKAPFRADEVGSLLRPPRIKEARAKLEKGEVTAEDLRKAEDLEIEKVVHKQASIGLKLATDGEFRRSWWHFDFLAKLGGCELFHPETGIQFAGVETRHDAVRVIGKLDFPDNHPMLEVGIDISGHTSKTFQELDGPFDVVITVCDRANESCPLVPGGRQRLHWSFDDPSAATGTAEQRLQAFRDVREGIRQRLLAFLADCV